MSFDDHDKQQARELLPLAIIVFLIALAITGFSITRESEDEYGCRPGDYSDNSHTVFLIDSSDTFSERHLKDLNRTIKKTLDEEVHDHDLFSIFFIEGELTSDEGMIPSSLPERKFFFCKPPQHTKSGLIGGEQFINEEYEKFKKEKLDKIFSYLKQTKSSKESPIIETLWQITNKYIQFSPRVKDRKLIIFSDLVEHIKPEMDSCSNDYPYNFEEFKKTDLYKSKKPKLKGVKTSVYYIDRRLKKTQGEDWCAKKVQERSLSQHQRFWRDLLLDSGATLDTPYFEQIRH